jgi:3-hydroxyacyl-CoA dehydrogenase/enoyl-CoA hydratase/3-hydroxybutyryl-CoA epimerase
MTNLNLQHWKLSTDAEGIAWAVLDKAGESANSLSSAVMAELGQWCWTRSIASRPRR